jgi:hypothetical protein
MVVFSIVCENKWLCKELKASIFMFPCTTVLYKHMKLLRSDVHNLFGNSHVRIKIYQESYHNIVYIVDDVILELYENIIV